MSETYLVLGRSTEDGPWDQLFGTTKDAGWEGTEWEWQDIQLAPYLILGKTVRARVLEKSIAYYSFYDSE